MGYLIIPFWLVVIIIICLVFRNYGIFFFQFLRIFVYLLFTLFCWVQTLTCGEYVVVSTASRRCSKHNTFSGFRRREICYQSSCEFTMTEHEWFTAADDTHEHNRNHNIIWWTNLPNSQRAIYASLSFWNEMCRSIQFTRNRIFKYERSYLAARRRCVCAAQSSWSWVCLCDNPPITITINWIIYVLSPSRAPCEIEPLAIAQSPIGWLQYTGIRKSICATNIKWNLFVHVRRKIELLVTTSWVVYRLSICTSSQFARRMVRWKCITKNWFIHLRPNCIWVRSSLHSHSHIL